MIKTTTQLVKPALIAMAFICCTTWMKTSSPAAHVVIADLPPGIMVAQR
jgi:hypothetical protein